MENTVCKPKIKDINNRIGYFERYLICGYFFLAFFEPYLNGVIGSLSKFYILILLLILILRHRIINTTKLIYCYIFWLILKMVSVIWTSNLYIPELHILSQIGMVALLTILSGLPIDKRLLESTVKTMWIGSTIIGFLALFNSHPYQGIVANRQVLYLFGQEADPNNQAAFLLIGLTIAAYNLLYIKKYTIPSFITLIINVYSLFMTGSRGGFVSLICIGVLLLVQSSKGELLKNNIKSLFMLMFVVCVLLFIINKYLPEDIFMRLFTFTSYEGGSERDIIWKNGWALFTSNINFLFGAGWGAYYGYNFFYEAMHNTFLAMLCDVGIVGFILFFLPIYISCRILIKRHHIFPLLMILAGFIPSFFLDAINKRFFWNVIILLFMYLTYSLYKEDTEQ